MGLFSNLFGNKEPVGETPTAMVYIGREYLNTLFTDMVNSGGYMFITFFQSTHNTLRDRIADENLKSRIIHYTNSFSASDIEAIRQFLSHPNARIAFAERYPLSAKETEVLQRLRAAGITSPVSAFCALNDTIMLRFGGEKSITLMQRMGMPESESINHPMISKSIHRAQEKTLAKVTYEQQAKSPEDWYRMNLPQG